MKISNYSIFLITYLYALSICSQETLPIYQDYLSDNVYLVHPAAAGIGEVGKIRVAIRMEGLGIANTPQLQTTNFHGKFGPESKAAFGIVLINNESSTNFSHKGLQATYAYHLDLDRTERFEQLSFGFSAVAIQTQAGGAQILQTLSYLNADLGMSYHLKGLSTYFTIKNVYSSPKAAIFSSANELNLRNYVFGAGYFFGDENRSQYEPSAMFQSKELTGEKIIDINFKIYKNMNNAQVWGALSYRKSFDSNSFGDIEYISPIVGVNFNKMMFSYTYTKQMGEIVLSRGAFHQVTLGLNVLFRELKLAANPNINSILF